jgi:SAM-dependent methyltransferase
VNAPAPPSPFFLEQLAALDHAARSGPVVDLACGRGRHALAAADRGARVIALDRNAEFLAALQTHARARAAAVACIRVDLEATPIIPLQPESCGVILVFRFLYRPLAPEIEAALRPGGLLLYETFTRTQLDFDTGPRNPAFLLAPGELPTLFPGLTAIATWEGIDRSRKPTAVARLAARKPTRGSDIGSNAVAARV